MRLPKNICDLMFSHDSYSKDYLYEVFAYLTVNEYLSLARVNKFMYQFIALPEVWQILADKNIQYANRTVHSKFEWKGISNPKPRIPKSYIASNGRMVAIANDFSISIYDSASAQGTLITTIPLSYTPQSASLVNFGRTDVVLTMDNEHLIFMESLVLKSDKEYIVFDRRIHIYATANIRQNEKLMRNHPNNLIIDVINLNPNVSYSDLIYDKSAERLELVGIDSSKHAVLSHIDINSGFGKSTVLPAKVRQILINKFFISWLTESNCVQINDRSGNFLTEVNDPNLEFGGFYLSEHNLVTFPEINTTKSMLVCSVHKVSMKQGKLTVDSGRLLFDEELMDKCSFVGMLSTKVTPLGYSESICFLLQNVQEPYDPNYTCHLRQFDVTCGNNLKTIKLY